MIAEQVTLRKQVPSKEGMWLYQFDEQSNTYNIAQFVWLGKEAELWQECNETEKAEFEAHNERVREEMENKAENSI